MKNKKPRRTLYLVGKREFKENQEARVLLHENRVNNSNFNVEDSIRLMSHFLYPNDIRRADDFYENNFERLDLTYQHLDAQKDDDLERLRKTARKECKKEKKAGIFIERKSGFLQSLYDFVSPLFSKSYKISDCAQNYFNYSSDSQESSAVSDWYYSPFGEVPIQDSSIATSVNHPDENNLGKRVEIFW